MSTSTFICPRESSNFIASVAKHVTINEEAAKKLAKKLVTDFKETNYSTSTWKEHPLHPNEANDEAAEWIFVLDSLNFSFWTPDYKPQSDFWTPCGKYQVDFEYLTHNTGYWALAAAVKRAISEGCNIIDVNVYATITEEQLRHVFRSETETTIPLFEERLKILHENGKILKEKFDGKFKNVILKADGSARKLLQIIVENFPSFRDQCEYEGRTVSFYKRAQILIADIWACFEEKGLGSFSSTLR